MQPGPAPGRPCWARGSARRWPGRGWGRGRRLPEPSGGAAGEHGGPSFPTEGLRPACTARAGAGAEQALGTWAKLLRLGEKRDEPRDQVKILGRQKQKRMRRDGCLHLVAAVNEC